MEILVYTQIEESGISDFSYDLISYAREISSGMMISCVLIKNNEADLNFECLKKYGADKVYVIKTNDKLCDKRKNPYLIIELLKKINPEIFILTANSEGREIAPIVASALNTGLTADCTGLEIKDGKLLSTRPTFGGKLMATIMCKKTPQMATVRKNTFKKKEFQVSDFEIEEYNFENFDVDIYKETEILDFIKTKENEFENLENAKIILAGGMGLKNKENFEKLKLLAKKIGAKAAGTRKAVDSGFIEKEFQIGQTGKTVTPEIYVAFGISGAIHHLMGMENSKKIIAINTDKNAPIFECADVGLITDAKNALDYLINKTDCI